MNKSLIIIVVSVIIVFLVAFSMGYYVGGTRNLLITQTSIQPEVQEEVFKMGYEAAKQKINESEVFGNSESPIYVLTGRVNRLVEDNIIFKSDYQPKNPLMDPAPVERTAVINESTKITVRTVKSDKEYESELSEYSRKRKAGEPAQYPSQYIEKDGTIEDFKEGQSIIISNESMDLSYAQKFDAEIIYIRK